MYLFIIYIYVKLSLAGEENALHTGLSNCYIMASKCCEYVDKKQCCKTAKPISRTISGSTRMPILCKSKNAERSIKCRKKPAATHPTSDLVDFST